MSPPTTTTTTNGTSDAGRTNGKQNGTPPPRCDDKKDQAKEKAGKNADNKLSSRLVQLVMGEIRPLLIGSVALLASSMSNQALPKLMGRLIDAQHSSSTTTNLTTTSHHQRQQQQQQLWVSLSVVVLGGGLASMIRTYMISHAEYSMASTLRKHAFASLLTKKDLQWYQSESVMDDRDDDDTAAAKARATTTNTAKEGKQQQQQRQDEEDKNEVQRGVSPGVIGTILNEDVARISTTLTNTVTNIVRGMSSVVFGTVNMLLLDPALFATAAAIIPAIGTVSMLLRKSVKRYTERERNTAMSISSFVEERLANIYMVKLSNREEDEVQRYDQMQDELTQLGLAGSWHNGILMGFMFAAGSTALLAIVHTGGRAVTAGKMTSGQLTSFATYSFLLGLGTSSLIKSLSELSQGMVSARRYYKLIDNDEDDDNGAAGSDDMQTTKSTHTTTSSAAAAAAAAAEVVIDDVESVAFSEVCFRYRSTGARALNKISFELRRGTVVALCGHNGSGKTSLGSVLAGLYTPESGTITLQPNHVNISALSNVDRKHLVQIVPQSTALFNTSILENVRYCHRDATEEQVQHVLDMANCTFVAKLPKGMHSLVGINGSSLSAGECQKLALARALLSDPAFLIMDEPASSLDAEGESAMQEAARAFRQGGRRGLLLITHDPKSLELADTVMVMKGGELVETGTLKALRGNPKSELCQLMPNLTR